MSVHSLPVPASQSLRYLLDTSVLLRVMDTTSEQHPLAVAALAKLDAAHASLSIAPQNLIEFWVVATRPLAVNGLNKTTKEASALMLRFKTTFQLLPDTPTIYDDWERLVTLYGVSGKPAHDARLVAFMRAHYLTHLLTFNGADFNRYTATEGITVVDPATIVATT